jgi:hypothetical protein
MTAIRTDVTSDVQDNFRIVVMSQIAHRPLEPPEPPTGNRQVGLMLFWRSAEIGRAILQ